MTGPVPAADHAASSGDSALPIARTSSKPSKQSKSWHARQPERHKQDSTKALERMMKEEKEAEATARKEALKERKRKAEEKARLERMAKTMSEKKLKRMKKRLNRSKKVAG